LRTDLASFLCPNTEQAFFVPGYAPVTFCDTSWSLSAQVCDNFLLVFGLNFGLAEYFWQRAGCLMKKLLHTRAFIWALLAVPSIPMVFALANGTVAEDGRPATEFLLHPTGEFAARFMIISLIITPFRMMFPKNGFWHWMVRRRRYFGVAAFAYAALHTALYLIDMGSMKAILDEFWAFGIWTGWVAFFVFLPLAVTSNDASVRLLGRNWKSLQRLVYLAAVTTLLHWIFVHNELGPALVHFVPLSLLEAYRLYRTYQSRPQTAAV
jgi:methionine sulfoxide reductase heme-binding subunit